MTSNEKRLSSGLPKIGDKSYPPIGAELKIQYGTSHANADGIVFQTNDICLSGKGAEVTLQRSPINFFRRQVRKEFSVSYVSDASAGGNYCPQSLESVAINAGIFSTYTEVNDALLHSME